MGMIARFTGFEERIQRNRSVYAVSRSSEQPPRNDESARAPSLRKHVAESGGAKRP